MLSTLAFVSILAGATAQMQCDAESTCTYTIDYSGTTYTMDFRRLCNGNGDYQFQDLLGHTYYAQICGTAAKSCLPSDWENDYEYGRVIQSWGSVPSCATAACVEERTGAPACCTENCQVIAVQTPVFGAIVPGDASQGVQLTYQGESPSISDPYHCDWNPATGSPFPRVTHYQFYCDESVTGFAQFVNAAQNASDDCEYFLSFKTSEACVGGSSLSGGWVFNIIVMVTFGAYALGGFALNIFVYKTWAFPNAAFWAEANSFAYDGFRFALSGFKKRAGGRGSMIPNIESSSSSSSSSSSKGPLFTNTSSASAVAAPSASSRNSYNAIGTEDS